MKKIRYGLSLILIATLLTFLVACQTTEEVQPPTQEGQEQETFNVGVVIANWSDPFHASVMFSMQKYVEEVVKPEYGDTFSFQYENSNNNIDTQWANVENLINNGADAIVILAVNSSDGATLLEMSQDSGVPIIPVTRALENGNDFPAYTTSDNIAAGEMCAQGALDLLNGEQANIAILLGKPANIATTERTQGYNNILEGNPNATIVAEEYGEYDRTLGMTVVENWIQSGLDFNVILSNNDEMAIGASLALAAVGRDDVIITGVDGTADGIKAVADGSVAVCAMQNGVFHGQNAVMQSIYTLLGNDWDDNVQQYVSAEYALITPDNVSDYATYWDDIIEFQSQNVN